jgi:hypothetical protein
MSFALRSHPLPNIFLFILLISPSADNTQLMLLYPITINKIRNLERHSCLKISSTISDSETVTLF